MFVVYDLQTMLLPGPMEYPRKNHTIPLRMWGILSFTWGMFAFPLTSPRKRFPDDGGGGGDDPGFLNGLTQGFRYYRFDSVLTPVIFIHN